MTEIAQRFEGIGGRFLTSPEEIRARLKSIKAYVFDWDGVFNSGQKASSGGSSFSEIDSMGLNLLRFSHFRRCGEQPLTVVISGEKNDTAFFYSERENFRYSYYKVAHKAYALDHLCKLESIEPENVCYFFDDVLDVPIAERCGIRIMVDQKRTPLFLDYCLRNKLADYITSAPGGNFAVREGAELLIGLGDDFDQVISARTKNIAEYQEYITGRRKIRTEFFTLKDNTIQQLDPRT